MNLHLKFQHYNYKNTFILFLLIVFIVPFNLNAQHQECGTKAPDNLLEWWSSINQGYPAFLKAFKEQRENPSRNGTITNSVPYMAHILRRSDGSGGLTAQQLEDAFVIVNQRYADANIEFFRCVDINYIDNTTWYDFSRDEQTDVMAGNNVDDMMNIYFANSVLSSSGSSLCGYANFPGSSNEVIVMRNSCTTNGSTLSHEIGHFFGLPHTHNGGTELVDGSNCSTAGDLMCDTPADPTLGTSTVNSACQYTGTATDANGDLYMPNPRNIMSYSRKSCRDFFSVEQYATMAYVSLTSRANLSCSTFNVDFDASGTTSCDLPLTVAFTSQTTGATSYSWDFNNDGVEDANTADASYTFTEAGQYDVRLTISNGVNNIWKTKESFVNAGPKSGDYVDDFQNFIIAYDATGLKNGWTTIPASTSSDFRWNADNRTTRSSTTGPSNDHTLGTSQGIYMYTEASSGGAGDAASLISPCITIPADAREPLLDFWYHMFGSNMGEMHIDIHDGNNWVLDAGPSLEGQDQTSQDSPFKLYQLDIIDYVGKTIQVRFRGVRGDGFRGDMAIDDFNVYDNNPIPKLSFVQGDLQIMESDESGTEDCRGYVDVQLTLQLSNIIVGGDATVDLVTSGTALENVDFKLLTPQLIFPENAADAQNFVVRVYDDAALEMLETSSLSFTISGSSDLQPAIDNTKLDLNIEDNDIDVDNAASPPAIAVSLNASEEFYLGPNTTVFFYDATNDNNLLARIDNLSDWDYGCTHVQIDRAGNSAFAFIDESPEFFISEKNFLISPENNNPSGYYRITLYFNETEVAGWETETTNDRAELMLIKSPGSIGNVSPDNPFADGISVEGKGNSNGVFDTDHYYVSSEFESGFSGFGAAKGLGAVPLPVELLYFEGQADAKGHLLLWETASEDNSDYFEVERSVDGRGFEAIGKVAAAGYSTAPLAYQQYDYQPAKGTNYYRLRQVDLDGSFNYSEIIALENKEQPATISLFPNPTRGLVNVEILDQRGTMTARLYNHLGQAIQQYSLDLSGNRSVLPVDLSALAKGVYYLELEVEGQLLSRERVLRL